MSHNYLIKHGKSIIKRFRKPTLYPTELRGYEANCSALPGGLEGDEGGFLPCLLTAASAGEDLALAVSVPTSGAELDGGMGKPIDRF